VIVVLKGITPRLYQQTILGSCVKSNTLVVLPTGLGKTAIAMMLAALRLKQNPDLKILMLAPTKPLCEQHAKSFKAHLDFESLGISKGEESVVVFTGTISPKKRAALWENARIVISTPQGLENDVISSRIDLSQVSCLIFDEAHHATGDYSYVWVAKQYEKMTSSAGRILALTASPGSELDKIKEVCSNLFISAIEVRTDNDSDVREYVQEIEKTYLEVAFPSCYKILHEKLKFVMKKKLVAIQKLGLLNKLGLTKKQLLMFQRELQRKLSNGVDYDVMKALSLLAEALKVEHSVGLLECQGAGACNYYLSNLIESAASSKTKAVKNLAWDADFKECVTLAKGLVDSGKQHPKFDLLISMVYKELIKYPLAKILLFTELRDSALEIAAALETKEIRSEIFVGQAKKRGLGLTQKKQKEMLERFRSGEFPVMVATSVAEEGLDIPKVDSVIFFEPTPSAIRTIQRRGRTGRSASGSVRILVCKGTRDEAYKWAAHHKEKRMYKFLEDLKRDISLVLAGKEGVPSEITGQKKLGGFSVKSEVSKVGNGVEEEKVGKKSGPLILCDHREKGNLVLKELFEMDCTVRLSQLKCADYVLGGEVGVELKKVPDFVNSLVDGRLLKQVGELRREFAKSVVIVEGQEDIYSVRRVHANAIRGALASIGLGFGVPVLYTRDEKDTAELLLLMAKRSQSGGGSKVLHTDKTAGGSISNSQEYLISALPKVGPKMARGLLVHFGSVQGVINASEKDLLEVDGVGKTIASAIAGLVSSKYEKK